MWKRMVLKNSSDPEYLFEYKESKDDIFFINGTIWKRAMELKQKKMSGFFRKLLGR